MNNVNRLHEILNRARISDDEIRGGVRLSAAGLEKIAARLGTDADEVESLISALVSELRGEHEQAVTEDPDGRYTYEADFMGNLTIRDNNGGNEHYVGGSEAAHLLVALQQTEADSAAEQALLAQFCQQQSQGLNESEKLDEDFSAELKSSAGSYNFPWRVGQQSGTGTAAYRSTGGGVEVEVVDVRDQRGEEINANSSLLQAISQQAENFIGRE